MIKGIVRYWDLGRHKAFNSFKIIAKDTDDFNKQLQKEFSKYLMSRDISFEDGKIYAGFRSVGKFEFIAKEDLINNKCK